MIPFLLRRFGLAIVPLDKWLENELAAELHARHVAEITHLKAQSGTAVDIVAHIRKLSLDLRQAHAVCAVQQDQIIRLRNLAMVLEEQNAWLADAAGTQLADEAQQALGEQ